MKIEGKLRLRKYKGLLNLKISVVDVKLKENYDSRPWSDFGVPFGARRLPKGGPETSKREPQTTQTVSLECLWAAFWGRASRGGPGASRRQPRRPKRQKGPPGGPIFYVCRKATEFSKTPDTCLRDGLGS